MTAVVGYNGVRHFGPRDVNIKKVHVIFMNHLGEKTQSVIEFLSTYISQPGIGYSLQKA